MEKKLTLKQKDYIVRKIYKTYQPVDNNYNADSNTGYLTGLFDKFYKFSLRHDPSVLKLNVFP